MANLDPGTTLARNGTEAAPPLPEIAPFLALEVMVKARTLEAAGRHVTHLEIGQTAFSPPEPVREAMARCLRDGEPGYTEALGMPALRERIAAHYETTYGSAISPRQVVLTTGSSGAFVLAFLAGFRPGGRVGLPMPWYPAYPNILRALRFEPVGVRTGQAQGFCVRPEDLDGTGDLDGLIVASPANPTGAMVSQATLAGLADRIAPAGGVLVSDEIYHGITFDHPAETAAGIRDNIIVINSFSKYFAMPGLRLGWMVVPDNLVPAVERLAQSLFICPPALSQIGALAVFDCLPTLNGYVAAYRQSRAALLSRAEAVGFATVMAPSGAFYAYARLPEGFQPARAVCEHLLEERGVALTPGEDFDPQEGHRWVRLSFACPQERIHEAFDRMDGFFA
ncbi:MAG: aminotransferase class I/II-fold pyridoxal phosphate-dependent enzyme [Pseudomonadota bacterium]